jgi:hypothetical protein
MYYWPFASIWRQNWRSSWKPLLCSRSILDKKTPFFRQIFRRKLFYIITLVPAENGGNLFSVWFGNNRRLETTNFFLQSFAFRVWLRPCGAGLPDGLFSNQKSQFGEILECLRLEKYILWPFGIFYWDLVHFMVIWYILCSFGTFFRFWVSCTKENLATLLWMVHFPEGKLH